MVTQTHQQSQLSILIEVKDNLSSLASLLASLYNHQKERLFQIVLLVDGSETNFNSLISNRPINVDIFIIEKQNIKEALEILRYPWTLYHTGGTFPKITVTKRSNILAYLPLETTFPTETAKEFSSECFAWLASTHLLKSISLDFDNNATFNLLEIGNILEAKGISYHWGAIDTELSASICQNIDKEQFRRKFAPAIAPDSKVLAIIPHYQCQKWLRRCLKSLVEQTRSLDGIVVIDDGSDSPPISIVREFPEVTLLGSPTNVGPYRLIQQVIETCNYDAYLFQDADDWSTCERLEKLLQAATKTGAELVGTQEWRVNEQKQELTSVCYPLDVNAALAEKPGHPLLHPSSLVSRNLVLRLGGFATGLRFGGDTEFLLRAVLVAKIVNIPDFCYFRRKRLGSLTTHPDTGLDSPARQELISTIKQRAYANYAAMKAGIPPNLKPLRKTLPIELSYIAGLGLNE